MNGWRCHHMGTPKSCCSFHELSSDVGARQGQKDDDVENGFSDEELPPEADAMVELEENEDDKELVSEGEISEEDTNITANDSLGLLDSVSDFPIKKRRRGKRAKSPLFKIIMEAPSDSFNSTLDKWVEDGNRLGRDEISFTMLNLRRYRLYTKALQFLEWLEANKCIEFLEHDYASHLDLIAKVLGLQKAEDYIEKVPESLRGEVIYRTLLANCVATNNLQKSEAVFNKIKDLGLPVTTFSCNQLLLLYERVDWKKIANVLSLMERENVKPSPFTYRLLIDMKGRAKDVLGMEKITDMMRTQGVEPNLVIQAMVAKYYIFAGLKEKAEATLREIEGGDIEENHDARMALLPLYAALGKADEVGRIWKISKSNPLLDECLSAIKAWGILGQIENAEEVFENMLKRWKTVPSKYYNELLKAFVNNKLLSKGEEFARRMSDNGYFIDRTNLDALVKLYVDVGEVEKADSILFKAFEYNNTRPLYSSYVVVLDKYSERGDIHNAEKIFQQMRQFGYVDRLKPYLSLLQTYINAKSPAYGFRERMRADNVLSNKVVEAKLTAADPFRSAQLSGLFG
ncbi:DNA-binding protein [Musa troglodytarum]|uniref:DNA-binding protein n=1 Tax=Musa troglodytarum TaxID=320322 RepID=A0A9E7EJ76_9LILI|nr:DNA-binding protein [Musa troglodytarum]